MLTLMNHDVRSDVAAATDEALAQSAALGNLGAFDALTLRYEQRVYSFLRRRCRDLDVLDELTQSTFVEAWRSIQRYSPQWRFSTWLFTIATRQLTGWLRRADVHRRALLSFAAAGRTVDADDPSQSAVERESQQTIWTLVERTLDPVQQTALWLRYAESFSIGEVAHIIGRSTVTTRVILFRARQTLRSALEESEGLRANGRAVDASKLARFSRSLQNEVSHAAAG